MAICYREQENHTGASVSRNVRGPKIFSSTESYKGVIDRIYLRGLMARAIKSLNQADGDNSTGHGKIALSERLSFLAAAALYERGGEMYVFMGGPLDYQHFGVEQAWNMPIGFLSSSQGEVTSYFWYNLVFINCLPGEVPEDVEVEINSAPDLDLKLGVQDSIEVDALHDSIRNGGNGKPKIVVRVNLVENALFPFVSNPETVPSAAELRSHISQIEEFLGKDIPVSDEITESVENQLFEASYEVNNIQFSEEKIVQTEVGRLYITRIVLESDPWKYYELISAVPLSELVKNSNPIMRVDSGCDIGECLLDGGCDCRAQLHHAIIEAIKSGGFVLHIPGHDGRGYGNVLKEVTEGMKQGVHMWMNSDRPPQLTGDAAETLYGPKYDIRDYYGAGEILKTLGINQVQMITDNRLKLEQVASAGINVERVATGSQSDHTGNKHQNKNIYY